MNSAEPPERRARRATYPLFLGAVAGFALLVVSVIAVTAHWSISERLDHYTSLTTHAWMLHHTDVIALTRVVTNAGSPISVDVITAVIVVALIAVRRHRTAVYFAVIRLLELGLETVLKHLVARPRPVLFHPIAHASGLSFPSGHAAGTAVLLTGALLVLLPTRGRWNAVALVTATITGVAVATSRVLLGVHYPTDVLAGAALGVACALACASLFRLPRTNDSRYDHTTI